MTNTLIIDPGIRGCGVSVFGGSTLARARYARNPMRTGNGPEECRAMAHAVLGLCLGWGYVPGLIDEVVVEWPVCYNAGQQKGDQNDLPPLVGVDLAVCMLFPSRVPLKRYFPAEWKTQASKEVMLPRIRVRLSEEELSKFESVGALDHNTWDSVGIGLHHFGRLARTRVYPR